MDAKVTLSFDAKIIDKAKHYAKSQGISLSRLTEVLLRKATTRGYRDIEDIPVADWVNIVSEGEVEYVKSRKRNKLKKQGKNLAVIEKDRLNREEILSNIKKGLEEVQLFKKRKLKTASAEDFLNEI